ncbi:MAG: undecaprenyl diphosphate synthase family protein [Methanimicrococcus sp.]|nr:undecaprenyl diphosphate synthase family protein [Methanimicrococcus sp.]
MKDDENQLETLLLTLNESDFLSAGSTENLFLRFPFIRDSGVELVIVRIDFLSPDGSAEKNRMTRLLSEKIKSVFQAKYEGGMSFQIYGGKDSGISFQSPGKENFSVIFSMGPGGRDELKTILLTFIQDCKAGKANPADMDPNYISAHLDMPFTPDLIVSSSKNKLTDYMIWQTVYSEYYFMSKEMEKWTNSDFKDAFSAFHNRERRYGV